MINLSNPKTEEIQTIMEQGLNSLEKKLIERLESTEKKLLTRLDVMEKKIQDIKNSLPRAQNDEKLNSELTRPEKEPTMGVLKELNLKEKCLQNQRFVTLYGDTHPSQLGEKFVIEWRSNYWFASNPDTWVAIYRKLPYYVLSMMYDENEENRRKTQFQ